ncbi:MAG: hypothetical protein V3W45_06950 [Sedimentisphaerales bacterium]
MGTIIDYEYRHADRLRASPNNRVVTRPSEKFEGNYYMQNKPNFQKSQMNVSIFSQKAYENISDWTLGENKPNQTQFQPKNEANKPKTNPISIPIMQKQTQSNPFLSAIAPAYLLDEAQMLEFLMQK